MKASISEMPVTMSASSIGMLFKPIIRLRPVRFIAWRPIGRRRAEHGRNESGEEGNQQGVIKRPHDGRVREELTVPAERKAAPARP